MRSRKRFIICLATPFQPENKYAKRQEACLNTWIQDQAAFPPNTVEVLLIHCDPTLYYPQYRDGRLWVPGTDQYHELHLKLQAAYRWILDNRSFDFVFKCDDDTYVFMDRLVNLLASHIGQDFLGADLGNYYDYKKGEASGGAGYALSPRALTILADATLPQPGPDVYVAEDQTFSQLLKKADIALTDIATLYPGFGREGAYYQHWIHDPNTISIHHSHPEDMYLIQYLKSAGLLGINHRVEGRGDHPHWQRAIWFYANGTFSRTESIMEGSWFLENNRLTLRWAGDSMESLDYDSQHLRATGPGGFVIQLEAPLELSAALPYHIKA